MSVYPQGIVPGGQFLGNDSEHNFVQLAGQYLQTARFAQQGFENAPEWPIYDNAFRAMELYLKAYLLRRGATLDHLKFDIGHKLLDALTEARSKGLVFNVIPEDEAAVMKVSGYYTNKDLEYRSIGEFELLPPGVIIAFVEHLRKALGY